MNQVKVYNLDDLQRAKENVVLVRHPHNVSHAPLMKTLELLCAYAGIEKKDFCACPGMESLDFQSVFLRWDKKGGMQVWRCPNEFLEFEKDGAVTSDEGWSTQYGHPLDFPDNYSIILTKSGLKSPGVRKSK